MNSYRDLLVWEKSMELVSGIYLLTNKFPDKEKFGLTSQIQRCAVSIPSNIAEGRMRGTQGEFRKFLYVAYGSGAELETQLEIAKRVGLLNNEEYKKFETQINEIMKMLNVLISKVNENC